MASNAPVAKIRPIEAEDDKMIRFRVAKAQMEGLAMANTAAFLHPLTLLFVSLASYFMINYLNWWPQPDRRIFGYLRLISAIPCVVVPILALFDWLNRPYFDSKAQEVLRGPDFGPDFSYLAQYYARSSASGFWILEYGDTFVGLIAIDASHDALTASGEQAQKLSSGTSSTATIRHFYVEEQYRPSDIQVDLLAHALRHVQGSSVERIQAKDFVLASYLSKSLQDAGFVTSGLLEKLGIFRWPVNAVILDKKKIE